LLVRAWALPLLLFLAVAPLASAADVQCASGETLQTVSFGRTVNDGDVMSLLAKTKATAYEVFVWSAGELSTVRIQDDQKGNPLSQVRDATVTRHTAERGSVKQRAAAFVAQHTRGDVVRDPQLFQEAKDLLREATRHDAVVTKVKDNKPMVWAVAVCAAALPPSEEYVVTLGANPDVPQQLRSRYPTTAVDFLSPAEAYAKLAAL
jgi:hypothetical protein